MGVWQQEIKVEYGLILYLIFINLVGFALMGLDALWNRHCRRQPGSLGGHVCVLP